MTDAGPLGRNSMTFRDKMNRYFTTAETVIYASEILCPNLTNKCIRMDEGCPFMFNSMSGYICARNYIRNWLGDHVEQHDIPAVPPCQCGGDCGRSRKIGICPEGAAIGTQILCKSLTACQYQKIVDHQGMAFCTREAVALKVAEDRE